MALLIDVFGYASVILRGLTIITQSLALGGILFLLLLARPLAIALGCAGERIQADTARIAAYGAVGLMLCEGASVALQTAVLAGTVDLDFADSVGTDSAVAGIVGAAVAAVMAILLFTNGRRIRLLPLLALVVIELGAATMTTHAFSRLENRTPLMLADGLHQLGAALWIGGIPIFCLHLLMRATAGRAKSSAHDSLLCLWPGSPAYWQVASS